MEDKRQNNVILNNFLEILYCKQLVHREWTKHTEVYYHFIKEKLDEGITFMMYVS